MDLPMTGCVLTAGTYPLPYLPLPTFLPPHEPPSTSLPQPTDKITVNLNNYITPDVIDLTADAVAIPFGDGLEADAIPIYEVLEGKADAYDTIGRTHCYYREMLETLYPKSVIDYYDTSVPVPCSNTKFESLSILDVGTGTGRTLIDVLYQIPPGVALLGAVADNAHILVDVPHPANAPGFIVD
ncbi:MAG: hypothetical protein L6R37_006575 [Teloschistes peruensis]|nr:MAG: hypothetical protein L6R37_006575 [Teloschistes peruensis]